MTFDEIAEYIKKHGPDRVVVYSTGEAWPTRRAKEELHITPDIIFFRGDGWSLGAPAEFAHVAESTWRDEWIGVWRKDGKPPERYKK